MFYTKQQVSELLGIPDSTLYHMVHDGRLHAFLPAGRKRGYRFFPEEVEALAVAQGNVLPTVVVTCASEHELAQQVALSFESAGPEHTLRWSVLRDWRGHCPGLFLVAKAWRTQEVLGATCLVPRCEDRLHAVLDGTLWLSALTADDLGRRDAGQYLVPMFLVAPPCDAHLIQLALARGLLHVLSDLCRSATPPQRLYAPGQPQCCPSCAICLASWCCRRAAGSANQA